MQRTLKFVKYLREFGWEPVVLTAGNADYPVYDETLYSEVPDDVRVYRSRIFEPYRLYRKFTGRRSGESTDIATLTSTEHRTRKFSERL
ncbi:glycosyltransferase family 4 protein, partial [candidate division KSB1 bacterium]|nr:glycosyltransferase family 4 protein [candidate division KSB1 bacterium]NIR68793.1 glycosyltransferase family 4 protein [candidate division KSB1 bacterium]NIS28125.1 glycosyltransferase family 4 protein [candidate division KSB1 bacterium]NIT75021.1 glycosyltransferase family 4 protein [candidate division KSB1 bacterium]NIU28805.1 glycosyltransferase family 4 protein [candidate division KSB1 bacterium]